MLRVVAAMTSTGGRGPVLSGVVTQSGLPVGRLGVVVLGGEKGIISAFEFG